MTPFFIRATRPQLAQGDYLTDCPIPTFPADFGGHESTNHIPFERGDLIVVTQSCDLENRKVPLVALCPAFRMSEFANFDPKFQKPGERDHVRKGRYEALHMLASPENPADNTNVLIVDFRQIISLPFDFLSRHADRLGPRWRLQSPFLEHFSQAFARFFMRVGLPSTIPPFSKSG